MIRALNTAATGMRSQEENVNAIANNVANANTTAFKRGRAEFEDLMYQTVQNAGARSSAETQYNVGIQLGSGSKVSATRKINTQGSAQITNNPFDLMINGEGYFAVTGPNGQLFFTRDGSFNPNNQGAIVNQRGYTLFPGFNLPPNIASINIAEDGKVDVYFKGQTEPQNLGTVPVFTFMNPVGLRSEGQNLMSATATSGQPIQNLAGSNGSGAIQQGALESSNVNVVTEMTDMIKAQRAYEMNAKVLGVADQMLHAANNVRN